MKFKSEILLNLLAYDSEEFRFLTQEQRIALHRERIRQVWDSPPAELGLSFSNLLIKMLLDMKNAGWENPEPYYSQDDYGNIIKKFKNR